MKIKFILMAALCFGALCGRAQAQEIYSWNDLQIWEYSTPTEMLASAWMQMDYSSQVYYNLYMGVDIIVSNDAGTLQCANGTPCWDYQQASFHDATMINVTAALLYDPADEYETKAYPKVDVHFRSDDGIYFRDYYNFATFQGGVPVLWPAAGGAFSFIGPGPPVEVSYTPIFLGTLNTLFSGGEKHGTPHHLKVVLDRYEDTSCGSVRRLIRLQPVDDRGRSVGRISVEETFESTSSPSVGYQSVYNSCQNDNYAPGGCREMINYYFTDQLWVGCPSAGGDCGFPTVTSRWWWCPRSASFGRRSLAANVYEVRHDRALVNGRAATYSEGAWFR